jgi:hypothetical protein
LKQFFCRHQWLSGYFRLDEYEKEYSCAKYGKMREVSIDDCPEFINVLPADYYDKQFGPGNPSKQI